MQKRASAANGSEADLEPLVALFRLLSDKTRLNILTLLSKGERNVSSLCDELRLPQPTVSHHLGLLRMSNLITNRRDGKQVFYELDGRVDAHDATSLQVSVDRFKVSIAFPHSPQQRAAPPLVQRPRLRGASEGASASAPSRCPVIRMNTSC